ncbi:MAG: anthranilate synthase component I family protein [Actinomycetota bacterium]|nr:anthranilate synthase component I family protein [Actinomycetota bacterium]
MAGRSLREPSARFGTVSATGLVEVVDLTTDASRLDGGGWWAVAATFEGAMTGYRFERVVDAATPLSAGSWVGPERSRWRSSLDRDAYCAGVQAIRGYIAAGTVYQVNLCRMLTAVLDAEDSEADPWALAARLNTRNPAPHAGILDLGADWIVSASPELFLARDGDRLTSSPIKGTAAGPDAFCDKDFPENIMITDLVRNDLGRLATPGSVVVTELLKRELHPGLAHLVSTVTARLRPGHGWTDILAAMFPPGSVSGAPKHTALQVISELEPVPRGVYCGAFGFVDADRRRARLAVGIRTFHQGAGELSFGTGAGITWGSAPLQEWRETELKADRLVGLASLW